MENSWRQMVPLQRPCLHTTSPTCSWCFRSHFKTKWANPAIHPSFPPAVAPIANLDRSIDGQPQNSSHQQSFDARWQKALDSVVVETSLNTVQCLVLAQLYCSRRGDYEKLLHYKDLTVGLALRLGLNRSQRKFASGALQGEMRKRVFWCVYCLDV